MDAQWIKSPTARRILVHWADSRPAWLWSGDGGRLIWRNRAARLFLGRVRKSGIKLAAGAVPIRGLVARLFRLGSVGRSSLSRIQFLAGDKPVSTTCTCTPLRLADDGKALLIVGVDAVGTDLLDSGATAGPDPVGVSLFPPGAEYLVVGGDGRIVDGSPSARERFGPEIERLGPPASWADDTMTTSIGGEPLSVTRYRADQHDATLLLLEASGEPSSAIEAVRAEEGLDPEAGSPAEPEPLLPLGLAPLPAAAEIAVRPEEQWVAPPPESQPPHRLSSLFDQLAGDTGLYAPLSTDNDPFAAGTEAGAPPEEQPDDPIAALIHRAEAEEFAADAGSPVPSPPAEQTSASEPPEAHPEPPAADQPPVAQEPPALWRIIGRGFRPLVETAGAGAPLPEAGTAAGEVAAAGAPPVVGEADRPGLDRTSRYNFDELGRILADRIGNGSGSPVPDAAAVQGRPAVTGEASAPTGRDGNLVNLAGETFILNRLPLGILVFRNQQVLFANRALVDVTGYESIDSLRTAGITAIFPAEGTASAGPVTHLVHRDGPLLPVNARLQSISWHGQPALMLSASPRESRPAHEAAVKAFAELAAELREDGYFAADRDGLITHVSLHGRILVGSDDNELVGRPLTVLVDPAAHPDLRALLDRAARFAETARPATMLAARAQGLDIAVFAEGQAGVVTGYFGFIVRREHPAPAVSAPQPAVDGETLGRIGRDVRRPLNTIIGFADLIHSAVFGPIDVPRYTEYAGDIGRAGQEIARAIDELESLIALRGGRVAGGGEAVDLVALLDTSLMRLRPHAAARRVLVRSAVPEWLPRVKADAESLAQAVLNLMASAIEQSPPGSSVILSAKRGDDGGVVIHIRDGASGGREGPEQLSVFRRDGPRGLEQSGRSSIGLALTRSLLAVNALSLSIDPGIGVGTLYSMGVPADLVVGDEA